MAISQQEHIVIVGASAAGLSTLEGLRREGFDGRVTMVGEENRAPYDRPPLSKQFMAGDWDTDRVQLRNADAISALDAQWLLGTRAEALDATNRVITLSTGKPLGYDQLVIATGVTPRTLPGAISGVHTLKSLDDAITLREELAAAPDVVVIGAGPLGSEFAATARGRTDRVTLIDPSPTPLYRQLGLVVGEHIADLHRNHGVSLRMGVGAAGLLHENGRVTGVQLTDGSSVDAQLVLVAIGSVPNTAWLTGAGLTLDNGLVCDMTCAAAPGIYAAGDVARWYNPTAGELVRIEHRMNANEQGMVVARNLLGQGRPYDPTPYFWTDHYDTTIQVRGTCGPDFSCVVAQGGLDSGRFVALYGTDSDVTAVLSCNSVKQARGYQHLVSRPHTWADAIENLEPK
ncbi:FAD-dependent oxidoreductase [Streptomyces sp. GMY02]|uniref:NAD(P)/FAD-dependent oxidoreductase n=1 Tax=Streptomyces sp. GMY02 TaxID=1333528 RepID=UPI001C2C3498|nr:FAD-dependent oxidoreductase [Streptomyces sp. GMY02]QXE38422.1 FAD-dependent oxidoreductase [Streptomyces sp. GMY02]